MKEELEGEKANNLQKIKSEEFDLMELERLFKHAKFGKKLNIARLEKANKDIDQVIAKMNDNGN